MQIKTDKSILKKYKLLKSKNKKGDIDYD